MKMKCENFYKNYVQEGFLVEMKKLSPAAELISSFPRESVFWLVVVKQFPERI